MTVSARLVQTIEVGDILGEGVLWRATDQTVWWTDINGLRLHCLSWPSLDLQTYPAPGRVGTLAFIEGRDDVVLIACEDRIGVFTPETGETSWMTSPLPGVGNGTRLNDGRTDPMGRFWVGSLEEGDKPQTVARGHLYRWDAASQPQAILGDIRISNGICWAPDGSRFYFADSALGQVFAAPYNLEHGVPGMFIPFAHFTQGAPDGAVTDSDGNYWTALWGASRLAVLDPKGDEIASVDVPALQPTCPAFGGPEMNLLFVTSAKAGQDDAQLAQDQYAGSLFIFETASSGIPPVRVQVLQERKMSDAKENWPQIHE